jgi:class 3 adenylate cyclase
MTRPPVVFGPSSRNSLALATALAIGIFLTDTLSSLQFAVASLYVIVVLMAAQHLDRRALVITSAACALLTILSYVLEHGFLVERGASLRCGVSLISLLTTTILVLRSLSAETRLAQIERERATLARFFSPKILEQLVDIDVPFSVARPQSAAVLFVDMIEFTAYSSGKPPDAVIGMLRTLLRLLSEAVFSHHGSIDKFLGDGLLAFFGPPLTGLRDATNAANCALKIVESVDRWNRDHDSGQAVRVAVGIHFGEVVQVDVGSEKLFEFTVVGDTVNIASRVETYCRYLEAAVLVTGEFVQALLNEGSQELANRFGDEGLHQLRGRAEPIRLFSVKGTSGVSQDEQGASSADLDSTQLAL